jgi:iron(III) transport system substrate-binding protein
MTSRAHRLAKAGACAVALALVAAACGDDADDGASATTAAASAAGQTTAAGGAGEARCGASPALVAAAQEEGEVVLFGGGHTREGGEMVAQMFEDAYGISVTVNRQPSGDIVQQVEASLEAGAAAADVVSLADVSTFIRWNEEGIITDAEVPNVDQLIEGIVDPSRPSLPYAVSPLGVVYNSARIDPSEAPTSWAELKDLGGKVLAHANPSTSGTAVSFMYMASEAAGEDYYDAFEGQDILITDSALALNQLVLTGEADYGAPAIESEVTRAKANGEPLEIIYPEEGVPVFSSELAALTDAPHPNAAKLLVQYHLCEEFQDELAGLGGRPALLGAPSPEGLPDMADWTIVTVDVGALSERREALIQQFEAITG